MKTILGIKFSMRVAVPLLAAVIGTIMTVQHIFEPDVNVWALALVASLSGLLWGCALAGHILDGWEETLNAWRHESESLQAHIRRAQARP